MNCGQLCRKKGAQQKLVRQLMNILIADDHVLVAELIQSNIKAKMSPNFDEDTNIEIVGTYSDTLHRVAECGPYDLIILDYNMPDRTAPFDVSKIVDANSGKPVVIVSGSMTKHLAEEAMSQGAKGAIPKSVSLRTMIAALNFILAGESFVPWNLFVASDHTSTDEFTKRELDTLRLLAEGMSNKEISHALSANESTVKMHLRRLGQKLGVNNRLKIVAAAQAKDLI